MDKWWFCRISVHGNGAESMFAYFISRRERLRGLQLTACGAASRKGRGEMALVTSLSACSECFE